jgi:hypothetical protein
MVYRSNLPIGQDNGFTGKFDLSLAEFDEFGGCSRFDDWHTCPAGR